MEEQEHSVWCILTFSIISAAQRPGGVGAGLGVNTDSASSSPHSRATYSALIRQKAELPLQMSCKEQSSGTGQSTERDLLKDRGRRKPGRRRWEQRLKRSQENEEQRKEPLKKR